MTEWAPATDAEVAMRDALRTDDQESYFRILAGVDLLLPVSADALAGLAPLGWGTWSTGGRTHVLAFTSPSALQACLADYTGSARRVPYAELADTWPNLEWWLAVNPGLPIEGYLPAWFVAQLSRGDLRLPTRGPTREGAPTPSRDPQDLQAAAMAANAASHGGSPGQGGPATAEAAGSRFPSPTGGSGFGGAPGAPANAGASGQPGGGQGRDAAAAFGSRGGAGQAPPVGPGGLPVRTPGAVLPSGLPSRVPSSAASQDPSPFPGFSAGGSEAGSAAPTSAAPNSPAPISGVPAAYQPPGVPGGAPSSSPAGPAEGSQDSPARAGQGTASAPPAGRAQGHDPAGQAPDGQSSAAQGGQSPASRQDPRRPLPTRTPMAQTPPLPSHIPSPDDREAPAPVAEGALPRRPSGPEGPGSMAAVAQALAGSRSTAPATTPSTTTPSGTPSGVMPPVIPGAGGPTRSSTPPPTAPTAPGVPAAASGPTTPPSTPAQPDAAPADGDTEDEFVPANDVERELYDAADGGSTDRFLSTLLLATVLVPVANNSRPGSAPGESGFAFRTEEVDGERFLVVFTSRDRLAEHFSEPTRTVGVRFYELIRNWPDPAWSFAVNPESPVGAKYPGPQVIALASWAADAGLGADPAEAEDRAVIPVPAPQKVSDAAQHATVMQKTVPPDQVDYYLERGYDRVAGFVHRANEVDHLRTPGELFAALGLVHDGSPFKADANEAYVLRWPAYRPSLYRIPYGGQSEQALRAMDGWVIERPPFRGNGFAPGEGRDVIAEFKVDSVRLPHGAQLWRMDADGTERMVAIFDCDAPIWRRVGEQ